MTIWAINLALTAISCYPVRTFHLWVWVGSTYPPHDGYGLEGEEARIADFVVDDAVKHLLFVITREWRLQARNLVSKPSRGAELRKTYLSHQHFKYKNSQAPPVHCSSVRSFRQNFWCQKLWCPAEGSCAVAKAHPFLAETKICNFDVTLGVQKKVV